MEYCAAVGEQSFQGDAEEGYKAIDTVFADIKFSQDPRLEQLKNSPEFEELCELLDERMHQEFFGTLADLIVNMKK